MGFGVQSATTAGTTEMLRWCADNWGTMEVSMYY